MKQKVEAILAHGCNCFTNRQVRAGGGGCFKCLAGGLKSGPASKTHSPARNLVSPDPTPQLIYNYPEQLFADAGVMAIEHLDFDGTERLALVTGASEGEGVMLEDCHCITKSISASSHHRRILPPGGEIASTFDDPEHVTLGECDLIEEIMIGNERMIHFSGCKLNEACTIVLRGASKPGLVGTEGQCGPRSSLGTLLTTHPFLPLSQASTCSMRVSARCTTRCAC